MVIELSGDIDGKVPVTSTKYTLKELKLPVKTQWHPWYLQGEVINYLINILFRVNPFFLII